MVLYRKNTRGGGTQADLRKVSCHVGKTFHLMQLQLELNAPPAALILPSLLDKVRAESIIKRLHDRSQVGGHQDGLISR